jgi:hypothetical protein
MSQNVIADAIEFQIQKDAEHLKEKYSQLWSFLDTTELSKSQKDEISNNIERIVYLVERQSMQKNVRDLNVSLRDLYWSLQPSSPTPYYMHKWGEVKV